MRWDQIDTAPKDGTVVDLWEDGARVTDCRWETKKINYYVGSKIRQREVTCWWSPGCGCGDDNGMVQSPSHWMPVPDAPAA